MKHHNLESVGIISFESGGQLDGPEIPSGTSMWMYADSAPVGWTINGTPNDNILAVKGGSTYTTGGSQQGAWVISGLSSGNESSHVHSGPSHAHTMPTHRHTGPSHTHTTGSVALTIAQMPAHTHYLNSSSWQNGSGDNGNQVRTTGISNGIETSSRGSGSTHNHGSTGSGGTGYTSYVDPGNTNSGGTANTGSGSSHNHTVSQSGAWRPRAAVGIVCTKD